MPYQQQGISPPPLEMVNQSPMAMMQKIIMKKIQDRKANEERQYAEEQQKKEWAQREKEIDIANKNAVSKIKLQATIKAEVEKLKALKLTAMSNTWKDIQKIENPQEKKMAEQIFAVRNGLLKDIVGGGITRQNQEFGQNIVPGQEKQAYDRNILNEAQDRTQQNAKYQSDLIEDRSANERALIESRIKNLINTIKNDPNKPIEQKRYEISQAQAKQSTGSYMPNMGLSPTDRNTVELNKLSQQQKEMSLRASTLELSNYIQKLLDDVMPGTPKATSLQLAGWLINVPPDQFATELAKVIHKNPGAISEKWSALMSQIPQGITNLFNSSTPNLGGMPESYNASYLENELKKRNINKE